MQKRGSLNVEATLSK